MKQIAILIVFAVVLAGCSSSKPAPKLFTWESDTNKADAQKKVQQAETKDPCSAANLETASAEQKKKCDPTTGMSDSLSPKPSPLPPKKKTSRTAPSSSKS